MKRRQFISLLGGAAAWPIAARAQQAGTPVIGFLNVGTRSDTYLAVPGFRQGLREAGFVEGRNVAVEYRWADNQTEQLPALAADLVRRRVAVLVAAPNAFAIAAAKAATSSIPIVFLSGPDPVRMGLVPSLNRPGGNATGVTMLSAEANTERLGLLHDLVPQVQAVAFLSPVDRPLSSAAFAPNEVEAAGRNVGIRVIVVRVAAETDLEPAFARAVREGAGALQVATSISFLNNRDRLVALVARHSLPAIYPDRSFVAAGGLVSYSPSYSDAYRQVGAYTGRILKGEKPADLPVLQPTKFELVINLRTAKTLGLTIPPGVLAIADEVIE